ncbi:hypothetical protein [Actinophytocola gossypii]|uniref:Uncharacterized protein n=1 Tax=Actinophytocola gossypii TaxID=2812003 RepID=A0ABT2JKJ1_9PSEU|nr:hypothetical protein [Actinophytocola gossypii]MCT2588273.1 hypothetical protein [Actinophytocola gossypii]
MVTRNPYLLLGVDYGCEPDAARRSFARAARRIRRAGTDRISTEDLTWALHEIQNNHADPSNEVDTYRVPADPRVFAPAGEGFFAPAPTPLTRRTETTPSDVDTLTAGLADDVDLLLAEVLPHVVRFDYGYQTPEGTEL